MPVVGLSSRRIPVNGIRATVPVTGKESYSKRVKEDRFVFLIFRISEGDVWHPRVRTCSTPERCDHGRTPLQESNGLHDGSYEF